MSPITLPSCDLNVRRVSSVNEPAFDALIAIYAEAHAPSERKSPAQLASMLQQPGYSFLVANESNTVVGFSIVRLLGDSDAALLEYLAVARDCRSQGIGQQLFVETVNFEAVSSRFLLVEVDSDKTRTADHEDRLRRKRFYRGLGCREIDLLHYIMPPVATAPPPAMDMLVYKRDLPPHIDKARVRQWLECCYVDVYGMPANVLRIDVMVHELPENVQLI